MENALLGRSVVHLGGRHQALDGMRLIGFLFGGLGLYVWAARMFLQEVADSVEYIT